jgi:hypothetical protein
MLKIPQSQAINLWNKFTSGYSNIVPFSFNPSLFNFYQQHFNWKPYYLLLYKEDEICGVFPIVNTDKAWVSLPHFSYGGILINCKLDNFNYDTFINNIATKLKDQSSGFYKFNLNDISLFIETSSVRSFIRSFTNDGNVVRSEKVTSLFKLPDTIDDLLLLINSNLKRKVNKSTKSNLLVHMGKHELLDDFYEVYSKNIKHLNSLTYKKKFFFDLISSWNIGSCNLFVVYLNEKPIGSSFLVSYMGFYENIYFATLVEKRKNYISDLLHWKMITSCMETNKEKHHINSLYSFGRSTNNSGVFKYKNHWPVDNYPLYSYTNFSDIRKKDWLYSIWGSLPSFITLPIGSRLIRHIY